MDHGRIEPRDSESDFCCRPMDGRIPKWLPAVQHPGALAKELRKTQTFEDGIGKLQAPCGTGHSVQKPVSVPLLQ